MHDVKSLVHDVVREDRVLYTKLSGKTEYCTRRCQQDRVLYTTLSGVQSTVHDVVRSTVLYTTLLGGQSPVQDVVGVVGGRRGG